MRKALPGSSSSIRPEAPEGATAAVAIATQDFLGAWLQPGRVVPDDLRSEERRPSTRGRRSGARTANARRSRRTTSTSILESVARNADGTYRVIAGRLLPGKILGGFLYAGTRPDDPNDLVPHEHRRELRALRVFGAWTNLTDLKAANTLDTVRHGKWQGDRQTLSAGRRLDVRHVQRQTRVGPELRVFL